MHIIWTPRNEKKKLALYLAIRVLWWYENFVGFRCCRCIIRKNLLSNRRKCFAECNKHWTSFCTKWFDRINEIVIFFVVGLMKKKKRRQRRRHENNVWFGPLTWAIQWFQANGIDSAYRFIARASREYWRARAFSIECKTICARSKKKCATTNCDHWNEIYGFISIFFTVISRIFYVPIWMTFYGLYWMLQSINNS